MSFYGPSTKLVRPVLGIKRLGSLRIVILVIFPFKYFIGLPDAEGWTVIGVVLPMIGVPSICPPMRGEERSMGSDVFICYFVPTLVAYVITIIPLYLLLCVHVAIPV